MLINLAEVVRLNSNTIIYVVFAAHDKICTLFRLPIEAMKRLGNYFFVQNNFSNIWDMHVSRRNASFSLYNN